MESEVNTLKTELSDRTVQIFEDFMTGIAELEQLRAVDGQFLEGYQQALEVDTCTIGLREHLSKAKSILDELHSLVEDLVGVVQTATSLLPLQIEDLCNQFDLQAKVDQDETRSNDVEELEITDYAAPIAFLYNMVEQDYVMQEKIVTSLTSLNFKSSAEELSSYCMMWSLHPYINDEFMDEAWSLIR